MSGWPLYTWDGLEIAAEHPHGSTVVVRRPRRDGLDYLLLHRNANGAAFEGDWAWTAPAGARQPAEAVLPAALRELAEEAGPTGLSPWAVDLSQRWAVFAVDVPAHTAVELVDPEHDRFEWLTPQECRRRVLPAFVAAQQVDQTARVPTGALTFRPMEHGDLPTVLQWQRAVHAEDWFHGSRTTLTDVQRRYGPRLDGQQPMRMWVAQLDRVDIGYLQDYRVGDHDEYAVKTGLPDAVGFDYLIGDPSLVGRGLGTRMIWSFLVDVVVPHYPAARTFLASPDHRNTASLRALEKCGFAAGAWIDVPSRRGEPASTEIVCTFDRVHWLGP